MATLNDFFHLVEGEVPGEGVPAMQRAIRASIRELCERTHWWAETLATAVTLVEDTATYTLTPPANAEIVAPVKLWIVDEHPDIPLLTRDWLDRNMPGWDYSTITTSRLPQGFFVPSPGKIQLIPPPNAEAVTDGLTIVARAALKPSLTATTIDDRFQQAESAVRAGALYRLLDTAKPWGNVKRARDEEARFNSYVAEYRVRVMTGDGTKRLVAQTGAFGYNDSFPR
jgi:hypothetical protein